jgi:transmembrane protein 17
VCVVLVLPSVASHAAPAGDTPVAPVSEVESSVTLQALLYFNTWYSPVFLVMHLLLEIWRSANVETPQEFAIVSPLVLVLWCCNEPVRLWFGWAGNTGEKVPHLGTFFLLTLFPTLPCAVFFTLAAPNRVPGDVAMGIILCAFNVLEVGVAAYAIKALIRSQTEKFYLMQFGEPTDPVSADG